MYYRMETLIYFKFSFNLTTNARLFSLLSVKYFRRIVFICLICLNLNLNFEHLKFETSSFLNDPLNFREGREKY